MGKKYYQEMIWWERVGKYAAIAILGMSAGAALFALLSNNWQLAEAWMWSCFGWGMGVWSSCLLIAQYKYRRDNSND